MNAILTSLIDPKWANVEKTIINCKITTSQFGDEILPFSANMNDVEIHGRKIFADIASGKYGLIGDYEPLPEQSDTINSATPSSGSIPESVL